MALSKEELASALEDAASNASLDGYANATLVFEDFREKTGGMFGDGKYVEIDVVNADGESETITTGSKVVRQQLAKMRELDAFPFEALVSTYPTRFGNDGYKLEVA